MAVSEKSVVDMGPATGVLRSIPDLPPAPLRLRRYSLPVDMGEYDEEYRGWFIVFDLDTGLDTYETLAAAQDAGGGVESLKLMREWAAQVIVKWNFPMIDRETGENKPMPQPSDGGIRYCPAALLLPLAEAFGEALTPPKAG